MESNRRLDGVLEVDEHISEVLRRLRVEEGFRGKPYQDTVGVWTVGYGFNLQALSMPEPVADHWLAWIVFELETKCRDNFPWWEDINARQKAALLNMGYNLGWNGLNKFKRTLQYIANGEYEKASKSILNSKAAKQHESWGNPRYKHIAEDIKG